MPDCNRSCHTLKVFDCNVIVIVFIAFQFFSQKITIKNDRSSPPQSKKLVKSKSYFSSQGKTRTCSKRKHTHNILKRKHTHNILSADNHTLGPINIELL